VRSIPVFIAASREYLKRNGAPRSPDDLAHHDFIAVNDIDTVPFLGPNGKIEVPLRVVLRYRGLAGVPNAVAAGIGLAPLPDILFEEPEFKGVLTPVLTNYPIQEATLYIVYVSRKYLPLKIRAFIDFFLTQVTVRVPVIKLAEDR
jgi:DNA-binding transcriptional LysR family regulator